MRLAELVRVSNDVASTSARSTKVALLADLLKALASDEIASSVGMLSGTPTQGKIGVGWATVYKIEVKHASELTLDVLDLDRAIDEVRRATGAGSAGERRRILEHLLARATPDEADFIRRLFVGELRQGALEGVMAEAIARASAIAPDLVRRAVMLCGDLSRVAYLALATGEEALRDVGFQLFTPVQPMLASTAANVSEALEGFELASVEWKLDGIRVQIHRRGGDVKIYTRNLNDITEALPGVVAIVRALAVDAVVLDGEAIGLMEDDRKDGRGSAVGFLFDVLHHNGTDLLDEPLRDRLARLDEIAPGQRIPGVITDQAERARMVLEEALAAGHEGVVVKDISSTYAAGRRGKAWRKVKPVRTYDLVVLGAEWGHGRRQGRLSNLHLGARDPSSAADGFVPEGFVPGGFVPGGFVMVGKCFKGLTDELLEWQTKEILAREASRDGIFVRARPELVIEIAIDGVQRSTRYPGGLALRFARVKRYRPDKNPEEADTIASLQELLQL